MTPHPLWKPLSRNAPKDCVRYQVLALLRDVGELTAERLHELRPDITRIQATHHLYMLHHVGHCWCKRLTRKHAIYFATPELMEQHAPTPKPKPRERSYTKADPQAPAIVPEGVKITIGPSWTHDPRIQFAPGTTRLPDGLKGAGFVDEWNRLRRSSASNIR